MPKIKHIAFTVYPVTDMAQARHFYENVLGLALTNNYEDTWVEYIINTTCFALMDVTKIPAPAKPSADHGGSLSFEVDDLTGFVKELRGRGVQVLADNIESPICWQAYVMDPAGNAVGLHQKKAQRPLK
jgi:predicted enzyme related to lactoylglutathione lyase